MGKRNVNVVRNRRSTCTCLGGLKLRTNCHLRPMTGNPLRCRHNLTRNPTNLCLGNFLAAASGSEKNNYCGDKEKNQPNGGSTSREKGKNLSRSFARSSHSA